MLILTQSANIPELLLRSVSLGRCMSCTSVRPVLLSVERIITTGLVYRSSNCCCYYEMQLQRKKDVCLENSMWLGGKLCLLGIGGSRDASSACSLSAGDHEALMSTRRICQVPFEVCTKHIRACNSHCKWQINTKSVYTVLALIQGHGYMGSTWDISPSRYALPPQFPLHL